MSTIAGTLKRAHYCVLREGLEILQREAQRILDSPLDRDAMDITVYDWYRSMRRRTHNTVFHISSRIGG